MRARVVVVGVAGSAIVIVAIAAAAMLSTPRTTPVAARPAMASALIAHPIAEPAPRLENTTAYLPLQCYAKTHRPDGGTRNPCAACHRDSQAPNYVDDADAQLTLSMPRAATTNPWTNVFTPPPPATIDDAELLAWVRQRNDATAPTDCGFAPDADGWDRDARGERTGWRGFAYAPMPGMFWPTNGSAGDAFIRLPDAFQHDATGASDLGIYAVNLAIVEAMVRRVDVPIASTDETALGVDLDGDGHLATARRVAYVWPPRALQYVGQARAIDPPPAAGLFPVGTELAHSLRYLDVVDGAVRPAARMKEVRYMRKARWQTYSARDLAAKAEQREKAQDPDAVRRVFGDGERGVGTGGGWVMRGFIETPAGTLRAQTFEETASCVGCHGGVGASVDGTFSFARKTGWGVHGFLTMPEPRGPDGRGEYRTWLLAVGAGDDFASNPEVAARFFAADGSLRPAMARALEHDISVLVVPSPTRALALDRAYLGLVRSGSFARGRDVFVGTPSVEAKLVQGAPTGITRTVAVPAAR